VGRPAGRDGSAAAEAEQAIGSTATRGRSGPLALSPVYAAAVDRTLRREHDWQPLAVTLRDGLLAAAAP
jgi:hypothetical protein